MLVDYVRKLGIGVFGSFSMTSIFKISKIPIGEICDLKLFFEDEEKL
jgi:hypothetical protein